MSRAGKESWKPTSRRAACPHTQPRMCCGAPSVHRDVPQMSRCTIANASSGTRLSDVVVFVAPATTRYRSLRRVLSATVERSCTSSLDNRIRACNHECLDEFHVCLVLYQKCLAVLPHVLAFIFASSVSHFTTSVSRPTRDSRRHGCRMAHRHSLFVRGSAAAAPRRRSHHRCTVAVSVCPELHHKCLACSPQLSRLWLHGVGIVSPL